jgi:hypothetical protein
VTVATTAGYNPVVSKRALIVVLVLVAAGLWLRWYLSPEQVIRRSLMGAVEAFENEQLLAVMSVFDRGYRDSWGHDYEALGGIFAAAFDDLDDVDVTLMELAVAIDGETATTSLRFVVSGAAGGGDGPLFGEPSRPCTATLEWTKRPQGWRITRTARLDIPELREELDAARQP